MASLTTLSQTLPYLTDELACFDCSSRVTGWDWLKKVVNAIATIVVHVVHGVFTPIAGGSAVVFGSIFGAQGIAMGALVGAVYGFFSGYQCLTQATSTYTSCYTCVFQVSDSNDPCL